MKRRKRRTGHRRTTSMETASATVVIGALLLFVAVDFCFNVSHRYILRLQFFIEPFTQLIGVGNLPSEVAVKNHHRFLRVWELDLSDPLNVWALDTVHPHTFSSTVRGTGALRSKPRFQTRPQALVHTPNLCRYQRLHHCETGYHRLSSALYTLWGSPGRIARLIQVRSSMQFLLG